MDCRLSTTLLPDIWAIQTLAQSNQIDVSLRLGLLEKLPQTSDDLGSNARELVSFRILECFLSQGAQSNSLTSSSPKIAFDQSERCEDVLKRILLETPASSLKVAGPDMGKWDVEAFIAHKRPTLGKNALEKLKDAILTERYSLLASIKEQCSLPFGNPPESGFLGNGGKHDGTMHRFEGADPSPRISEGNGQLISPAVPNSSCLVHSDKPYGDLSPVKKKGRSITIISRGESSKDQITSKNDGEGYKELSEEYEDEIIHCGQHIGGKLSSSVVNRHLEDTSMMIGQYSKTKMCGLERSTNFQGTGTDVSQEDDTNECTSLKDIGDADEGTRCKDQAPHCDTELPGDKSNDGHAQKVESGEAKGDKEGLCAPISAEDIDELESHSKDSVQNGGGEGKNQDLQCYTQLRNDKCDLEHGQNETREAENDKENFVDLNSTEEGDKSESLSKDKVQTERGTSSRCKDGFEQKIIRNVIDLDDAHDVIVTGDCDGCLDERDDIATKKNAFLSSQCSFSQGSVDCRELNVCVKCNKGGKLLICSANSCLLVVHESCLGSHASFSTRGEFHCPFCAYSQAISEYMDIKKKASLIRKDFATFICLGAKKELKKQPRGSDMSKQHHLKHDDGLNKRTEPDNQDNALQNNNKRRRKLEFEKEGCSSLSSGDDSPSERKAVDSTNGKAHPSKEYTREMKKMRQSKMAASEILRTKGENASDKNPGKNCGSKISPNIESADHWERSEENDDSRAPKYPMRAQKHQKQFKYSKVPGLRRQRVKWTTAEEEKLEEGVRLFGTGEGSIPWRKILEHGSNVFVDGRSAVDLKDKWRNICRASPKT